MTSACLGNFGAYKLFYWNEHKRDFDFGRAEARLRDEILLSGKEKEEAEARDGKNEWSQQDLDRFALNNEKNEIIWVKKRLDTRDPRHLAPTPKEKLYTPRPFPPPRSFFVPPQSSPSLAKFTRAHEEVRPAASNQSTR